MPKYINDNFNNEVEEIRRLLDSIKENPVSDHYKLKIERSKFKTETGKHLYDLLINISDDNDFLNEVLYNVKGDEKKLRLIEYLEAGMDNKNKIIDISDKINMGIDGLDGDGIMKKFAFCSDVSYHLFSLLYAIENTINEKNPDVIYIIRIMSKLDNDEDREALINTIEREIEKKELNLNDFMSLINLGVDNYLERKNKERNL